MSSSTYPYVKQVADEITRKFSRDATGSNTDGQDMVEFGIIPPDALEKARSLGLHWADDEAEFPRRFAVRVGRHIRRSGVLKHPEYIHVGECSRTTFMVAIERLRVRPRVMHDEDIAKIKGAAEKLVAGRLRYGGEACTFVEVDLAYEYFGNYVEPKEALRGVKRMSIGAEEPSTAFLYLADQGDLDYDSEEDESPKPGRGKRKRSVSSRRKKSKK